MLFIKNFCLILFGLLAILFVIFMEIENKFIKENEKFKAKIVFKFEMFIGVLVIIMLITYTNL